MKIVVIGGSGLIGTKLVNNLRQRGHEAVAASPASGVDTITGEGLAKALEGAKVVVDVANSLYLGAEGAERQEPAVAACRSRGRGGTAENGCSVKRAFIPSMLWGISRDRFLRLFWQAPSMRSPGAPLIPIPSKLPMLLERHGSRHRGCAGPRRRGGGPRRNS